MKITLNDRPVAATPEDGQTLESLLDSLRMRGKIRGDEVVVEFRVDSRPWHADDMDRLGATRLADLSEVAIGTDDMRGCARRILADARSMLRVLQQAVPPVAQQFRSGPHEEANKALFSLLNALQQFLTCLYQVKHTCALQRDPFGASGELLDLVTGCLDGIRGSQERKDWQALGSRLEGELLPALQGFEDVLRDMIDET